MEVPIRRLDPDLPLPSQQHAHDAGYDLHAREDAVLKASGGRAIVPTGVAVAIPPGWAGLIMPRSGLALKHGVTCLNTPGLIDPLYRGELKVLLVNTDRGEDYTVHRGDRIAQLVVQRVEECSLREVRDLPASVRGVGGFGSSGGVRASEG